MEHIQLSDRNSKGGCPPLTKSGLPVLGVSSTRRLSRRYGFGQLFREERQSLLSGEILTVETNWPRYIEGGGRKRDAKRNRCGFNWTREPYNDAEQPSNLSTTRNEALRWHGRIVWRGAQGCDAKYACKCCGNIQDRKGLELYRGKRKQ